MQKLKDFYQNDEQASQSITGTYSSIPQRAVMENDQIEVYNYLDMHAVINNNIIEVFNLKKLQTAFL